MKQGIRDCCTDSQGGPKGKCCGAYDGVPGPVAGDKTKFSEESWSLGCPMDVIDQEALDLAQLWALCADDPQGARALFGCSMLDADNRTVEAVKVLDAEAAKIRKANPPKAPKV